jgi:hypothetical protein
VKTFSFFSLFFLIWGRGALHAAARRFGGGKERKRRRNRPGEKRSTFFEIFEIFEIF